MAEAKKEEVKPKGPLGKLKEAIDDKEEQMLVLSTFVRLGILIWAGGILTLNYVQFPGLSKQENIDPTFIASVFTGVLATFGVEAGQRKKNASSSGGRSEHIKERYGSINRESSKYSTRTNNQNRTSTNGSCSFSAT